MIKNIQDILFLFVCILALVSISGCMASLPGSSVNKTIVAYSDPETGIHNWVDAVNSKDIVKLYDLEPYGFKQEVSLKQFVTVNQDNEFISPNATLTGYEILNKTSNATVANLRVVVYWYGPVSPNSTQMETIPMFYNFEELFENGEWKVWETPW
ncbi:MAG: hypothetical protein WB986_04390 [Methanoregula sp.]|uniref:hypothetical protein n=1 Tax=Methanoregula sp. TaxID=2052170 RepID=UPI003BAF7521